MERIANLNNNEFIFATLGSKWTENHKGLLFEMLHCAQGHASGSKQRKDTAIASQGSKTHENFHACMHTRRSRSALLCSRTKELPRLH